MSFAAPSKELPPRKQPVFGAEPDATLTASALFQHTLDPALAHRLEVRKFEYTPRVRIEAVYDVLHYVLGKGILQNLTTSFPDLVSGSDIWLQHIPGTDLRLPTDRWISLRALTAPLTVYNMSQFCFDTCFFDSIDHFHALMFLVLSEELCNVTDFIALGLIRNQCQLMGIITEFHKANPTMKKPSATPPRTTTATTAAQEPNTVALKFPPHFFSDYLLRVYKNIYNLPALFPILYIPLPHRQGNLYNNIGYFSTLDHFLKVPHNPSIADTPLPPLPTLSSPFDSLWVRSYVKGNPVFGSDFDKWHWNDSKDIGSIPSTYEATYMGDQSVSFHVNPYVQLKSEVTLMDSGQTMVPKQTTIAHNIVPPPRYIDKRVAYNNNIVLSGGVDPHDSLLIYSLYYSQRRTRYSQRTKVLEFCLQILCYDCFMAISPLDRVEYDDEAMVVDYRPANTNPVPIASADSINVPRLLPFLIRVLFTVVSSIPSIPVVNPYQISPGLPSHQDRTWVLSFLQHVLSPIFLRGLNFMYIDFAMKNFTYNISPAIVVTPRAEKSETIVKWIIEQYKAFAKLEKKTKSLPILLTLRQEIQCDFFSFLRGVDSAVTLHVETHPDLVAQKDVLIQLLATPGNSDHLVAFFEKYNSFPQEHERQPMLFPPFQTTTFVRAMLARLGFDEYFSQDTLAILDPSVQGAAWAAMDDITFVSEYSFHHDRFMFLLKLEMFCCPEYGILRSMWHQLQSLAAFNSPSFPTIQSLDDGATIFHGYPVAPLSIKTTQTSTQYDLIWYRFSLLLGFDFDIVLNTPTPLITPDDPFPANTVMKFLLARIYDESDIEIHWKLSPEKMGFPETATTIHNLVKLDDSEGPDSPDTCDSDEKDVLIDPAHLLPGYGEERFESGLNFRLFVKDPYLLKYLSAPALLPSPFYSPKNPRPVPAPLDTQGFDSFWFPCRTELWEAAFASLPATFVPPTPMDLQLTLASASGDRAEYRKGFSPRGEGGHVLTPNNLDLAALTEVSKIIWNDFLAPIQASHIDLGLLDSMWNELSEAPVHPMVILSYHRDKFSYSAPFTKLGLFEDYYPAFYREPPAPVAPAATSAVAVKSKIGSKITADMFAKIKSRADTSTVAKASSKDLFGFNFPSLLSSYKLSTGGPRDGATAHMQFHSSESPIPVTHIASIFKTITKELTLRLVPFDLEPLVLRSKAFLELIYMPYFLAPMVAYSNYDNTPPFPIPFPLPFALNKPDYSSKAKFDNRIMARARGNPDGTPGEELSVGYFGASSFRHGRDELHSFAKYFNVFGPSNKQYTGAPPVAATTTTVFSMPSAPLHEAPATVTADYDYFFKSHCYYATCSLHEIFQHIVAQDALPPAKDLHDNHPNNQNNKNNAKEPVEYVEVDGVFTQRPSPVGLHHKFDFLKSPAWRLFCVKEDVSDITTQYSSALGVDGGAMMTYGHRDSNWFAPGKQSSTTYSAKYNRSEIHYKDPLVEPAVMNSALFIARLIAAASDVSAPFRMQCILNLMWSRCIVTTAPVVFHGQGRLTPENSKELMARSTRSSTLLNFGHYMPVMSSHIKVHNDRYYGFSTSFNLPKHILYNSNQNPKFTLGVWKSSQSEATPYRFNSTVDPLFGPYSELIYPYAPLIPPSPLQNHDSLDFTDALGSYLGVLMMESAIEKSQHATLSTDRSAIPPLGVLSYWNNRLAPNDTQTGASKTAPKEFPANDDELFVSAPKLMCVNQFAPQFRTKAELNPIISSPNKNRTTIASTSVSSSALRAVLDTNGAHHSDEDRFPIVLDDFFPFLNQEVPLYDNLFSFVNIPDLSVHFNLRPLSKAEGKLLPQQFDGQFLRGLVAASRSTFNNRIVFYLLSKLWDGLSSNLIAPSPALKLHVGQLIIKFIHTNFRPDFEATSQPALYHQIIPGFTPHLSQYYIVPLVSSIVATFLAQKKFSAIDTRWFNFPIFHGNFYTPLTAIGPKSLLRPRFYPSADCTIAARKFREFKGTAKIPDQFRLISIPKKDDLRPQVVATHFPNLYASPLSSLLVHYQEFATVRASVEAKAIQSKSSFTWSVHFDERGISPERDLDTANLGYIPMRENLAPRPIDMNFFGLKPFSSVVPLREQGYFIRHESACSVSTHLVQTAIGTKRNAKRTTDHSKRIPNGPRRDRNINAFPPLMNFTIAATEMFSPCPASITSDLDSLDFDRYPHLSSIALPNPWEYLQTNPLSEAIQQLLLPNSHLFHQIDPTHGQNGSQCTPPPTSGENTPILLNNQEILKYMTNFVDTLCHSGEVMNLQAVSDNPLFRSFALESDYITLKNATPVAPKLQAGVDPPQFYALHDPTSKTSSPFLLTLPKDAINTMIKTVLSVTSVEWRDQWSLYYGVDNNGYLLDELETTEQSLRNEHKIGDFLTLRDSTTFSFNPSYEISSIKKTLLHGFQAKLDSLLSLFIHMEAQLFGADPTIVIHYPVSPGSAPIQSHSYINSLPFDHYATPLTTLMGLIPQQLSPMPHSVRALLQYHLTLPLATIPAQDLIRLNRMYGHNLTTPVNINIDRPGIIMVYSSLLLLLQSNQEVFFNTKKSRLAANQPPYIYTLTSNTVLLTPAWNLFPEVKRTVINEFELLPGQYARLGGNSVPQVNLVRGEKPKPMHLELRSYQDLPLSIALEEGMALLPQIGLNEIKLAFQRLSTPLNDYGTHAGSPLNVHQPPESKFASNGVETLALDPSVLVIDTQATTHGAVNTLLPIITLLQMFGIISCYPSWFVSVFDQSNDVAFMTIPVLIGFCSEWAALSASFQPLVTDYCNGISDLLSAVTYTPCTKPLYATEPTSDNHGSYYLNDFMLTQHKAEPNRSPRQMFTRPSAYAKNQPYRISEVSLNWWVCNFVLSIIPALKTLSTSWPDVDGQPNKISMLLGSAETAATIAHFEKLHKASMPRTNFENKAVNPSFHFSPPASSTQEDPYFERLAPDVSKEGAPASKSKLVAVNISRAPALKFEFSKPQQIYETNSDDDKSQFGTTCQDVQADSHGPLLQSVTYQEWCEKVDGVEWEYDGNTPSATGRAAQSEKKFIQPPKTAAIEAQKKDILAEPEPSKIDSLTQIAATEAPKKDTMAPKEEPKKSVEPKVEVTVNMLCDNFYPAIFNPSKGFVQDWNEKDNADARPKTILHTRQRFPSSFYSLSSDSRLVSSPALLRQLPLSLALGSEAHLSHLTRFLLVSTSLVNIGQLVLNTVNTKIFKLWFPNLPPALLQSTQALKRIAMAWSIPPRTVSGLDDHDALIDHTTFLFPQAHLNDKKTEPILKSSRYMEATFPHTHLKTLSTNPAVLDPVRTALHLAFVLGAPPSFFALIASNVPAWDQVDSFGWTPLRWGLERVLRGREATLRQFGFVYSHADSPALSLPKAPLSYANSLVTTASHSSDFVLGSAQGFVPFSTRYDSASRHGFVMGHIDEVPLVDFKALIGDAVDQSPKKGSKATPTAPGLSHMLNQSIYPVPDMVRQYDFELLLAQIDAIQGAVTAQRASNVELVGGKIKVLTDTNYTDAITASFLLPIDATRAFLKALNHQQSDLVFIWNQIHRPSSHLASSSNARAKNIIAHYSEVQWPFLSSTNSTTTTTSTTALTSSIQTASTQVTGFKHNYRMMGIMEKALVVARNGRTVIQEQLEYLPSQIKSSQKQEQERRCSKRMTLILSYPKPILDMNVLQLGAETAQKQKSLNSIKKIPVPTITAYLTSMTRLLGELKVGLGLAKAGAAPAPTAKKVTKTTSKDGSNDQSAPVLIDGIDWSKNILTIAKLEDSCRGLGGIMTLLNKGGIVNAEYGFSGVVDAIQAILTGLVYTPEGGAIIKADNSTTQASSSASSFGKSALSTSSFNASIKDVSAGPKPIDKATALKLFSLDLNTIKVSSFKQGFFRFDQQEEARKKGSGISFGAQATHSYLKVLMENSNGNEDNDSPVAILKAAQAPARHFDLHLIGEQIHAEQIAFRSTDLTATHLHNDFYFFEVEKMKRTSSVVQLAHALQLLSGGKQSFISTWIDSQHLASSPTSPISLREQFEQFQRHYLPPPRGSHSFLYQRFPPLSGELGKLNPFQFPWFSAVASLSRQEQPYSFRHPHIATTPLNSNHLPFQTETENLLFVEDHITAFKRATVLITHQVINAMPQLLKTEILLHQLQTTFLSLAQSFHKTVLHQQSNHTEGYLAYEREVEAAKINAQPESYGECCVCFASERSYISSCCYTLMACSDCYQHLESLCPNCGDTKPNLKRMYFVIPGEPYSKE